MFNTTTRNDILRNSNSIGSGSTTSQQQAALSFHGHNSPQSQTAQFFTNISNSNPPMSSSPITNDSQREQPQFAPNFLFGNQQPTNRRSFATPSRHIQTGYGGSPGILKSRESATAISNSGGNGTANNKSVHWSPVLVRERSKSPAEGRKLQRFMGTNDRMGGKTAASTLWNGPPLRSLNEDLFGPPAQKISRLDTLESMRLGTSSAQSIPSAGTDPDEIIELDIDNSRTAGGTCEDADDIYWITVFGFPPAQREHILDLFSRHGDIMAHKPEEGNFNWVHIRYSSTIHARQALAKNASLFNGHMIGVVPCKDHQTMECNGSASQKSTTPSTRSQQRSSLGVSSSPLSISSHQQQLEHDPSLLLNGSRMVPSTSAYKNAANTSNSNASLPSRARLSISARAGMRPLNSSYFSDGADQQNQSMDSSILQKSGGADDSFIGKLWNMFTGTPTTTHMPPAD